MLVCETMSTDRFQNRYRRAMMSREGMLQLGVAEQRRAGLWELEVTLEEQIREWSP